MARRVLIVEDDPFLAMDLEDSFLEAGFRVLGPYVSVSEARTVLEKEVPDFATLDVDLGNGETSKPIASKLVKLGVPFVYVTGQAPNWDKAMLTPEAPVLAKPASFADIIAQVEDSIGA